MIDASGLWRRRHTSSTLRPMDTDHIDDKRASTQNSHLARFNRLRDRWRDHSLTLLLFVQTATIFGLLPASAEGLPLPPGLSVLLLLLLMSLTIIMAPGRWTIAAGLGTFLLTATLGALRQLHHSIVTDAIGDLAGAITVTLLSTMVAIAVFRPGRFSGHRVRGSVVLYLNLGLIFAFLHRLVAELLPGAYVNLPSPEAEATFRAALSYFSFSTLTSLGYGDIVPVRPIARSLCTLEAALGQLLPTLLIGRVVMLAMREQD